MSFSIKPFDDPETGKPTRYGCFSRNWRDEEAMDVLIDQLEAGQLSHKQAPMQARKLEATTPYNHLVQQLAQAAGHRGTFRAIAYHHHPVRRVYRTRQHPPRVGRWSEGSPGVGRRYRAGALASVSAMLPSGVRGFLCTQPTDMRKNYDGLITATRAVIGHDPLSGHLFVLVNRQANFAKILYWSRGGYCLWAKRLEQGRFAIASGCGIAMSMTDTELMMWIDGIDLNKTVQRKRFVLPDYNNNLR